MITKIKQWLKKTDKVPLSVKSTYHLPLELPLSSHDADLGGSTYLHNVIVYRCVNLIAQSAGHVPFVAHRIQNGALIRDLQHPVNHLLRRPSPNNSGFNLMREIVSNKLLFGNAYVLLLMAQGNIAGELYSLSPNRMSIITQGDAIMGYNYNHNGKIKTYKIDQLNQQSKILHLRNYNPNSQIQGLSCLQAAAKAIELHNKATEWNSSLLRNGARPSGALIIKDANNNLTEEQFYRLQDQLYEKYSGATNSGRPLLLEGGLEWKDMGISPKDMDFIESRNSAAREIALAFGVPPQLLGINGDNTYSNMQEARLALWEETILPLLDSLADALTNWLSYWYNEKLIIDFDRDAISALTEKRQDLWNKLNSANFMTINEKRALVGLKAINKGDNL